MFVFIYLCIGYAIQASLKYACIFNLHELHRNYCEFLLIMSDVKLCVCELMLINKTKAGGNMNGGCTLITAG
jgi:hypothetical protein